MGVEGLWDFISKKYPRCLGLVPRKSFKGYAVSIDANGFLYRYYAVSFKQQVYKTDIMSDELDYDEIFTSWKKKVMDETINLVSTGIMPVFVFDGDKLESKMEKLQERKEKKDKIRLKLEELMATKPTDVLRTDDTVRSKARSVMCHLCSIPPGFMDAMKGFLSGIGVPVVTGSGDGERLAAALCRTDMTAATMSEDGDCLAHLSPYLIRCNGPRMISPSSGCEVDTFQIVDLDILLEDMKMSRSMFQEFCILCGTDYNSRIPKVGPVTAYKLILEYQRIDNIDWVAKGKDPSCLRLESTRELFAIRPVSDLIIDGSLSVSDWCDSIGEHLSMYQMDLYIEQWKYLMTNKEPTLGFIHRFDKSLGNIQLYRQPGEYNYLEDVVTKSQANLGDKNVLNKHKTLMTKFEGTEAAQQLKSVSLNIVSY